LLLTAVLSVLAVPRLQMWLSTNSAEATDGVDSAGTCLRAQRHCSNFDVNRDSFCAACFEAFSGDRATFDGKKNEQQSES
jgi:hypothetical protein